MTGTSHAHRHQEKRAISIRASASLSDEERWHVHARQAHIFDLSETFATVDWYIFGLYHGQWVSMLEIAQRRVFVGTQPVDIALIGSVVTRPEWQHHGYATTVLQTATAFLCQRLNLSFGLLLCLNDIVPFYQQRGWEQITESLFYTQPSGRIQSDQQTMVYCCSDQPWPRGMIDLCGFPL